MPETKEELSEEEQQVIEYMRNTKKNPLDELKETKEKLSEIRRFLNMNTATLHSAGVRPPNIL